MNDRQGKSQDTRLARLSGLLYEAYRGGKTVESELLPADLSEADAYRVQDGVVSLKLARSAERMAGYKISLTSRATQEMAGTGGPAYGALTNRNLHPSPAVLSLADLNEPLVEGELVFAVIKPLGSRPTDAQIMASTRLRVAIEVPTSRIRRWFPIDNLHGFIGDCAGSGAVVMGDEFVLPSGASLEDLPMVMSCDGRVLAEGAGREVLGSPLHAVRWLVDKLAGMGRRLEAGYVVSSGTFIPPVPARPGTFVVDVAHLGHANVLFAP